ncbi:MAG: protein-glutamate O-methyltransferase [Pseudomonadota bacterium]
MNDYQRIEINSSGSELKDRDFSRLSQLIYKECGIWLPAAKKTMLSTRLVKRLRTLRLSSFADYYDYVTSLEGRLSEMPHMIDVVSTNKTDFFRESSHFDYLQQTLLPQLVRRKSVGRAIRVWSAGCSSGEEPYTLAMTLVEWMERNTTVNSSILATDISRRILEKARLAIYPKDCLRAVPPHLSHRFFMRGKGAQSNMVRVVPEIRNLVTFRWLNLMEPFINIDLMDIIFCRNVIIYFDRDTQSRLMDKYMNALVPGGHLFLGHSETLNGINDRFIPIKPTIYQRPEE